MDERYLPWLDRISVTVLLLWVGMALGVAALAAPAAFHELPSRDLAGRVIGVSFRRVDLLAWIAFGLALALSFGSRWLLEIKDPGVGIGPLRLWSAALLVALLMCFTSAFIVSPKMESIRAGLTGPIERLSQDDPARKTFNRAHGVSRQLLVLRLLLALGLAGGAAFLPSRREEAPVAD